VVRYWVQEYHIDGIRFDAVRQLANYEFMDWLAKQSKKNAAPKPFYNIAEHIPDTSTVVSPEGPLDACWHESFRYFIIPHICGETFELEKLKEVLDPRRQGYEVPTNVINYLSTHDRERVMRELGERGIFDEAAFGRAKLGTVLLMTAMGVPMLWMGEEFGEHKRKSETVTQPKKIAWPLLERDLNRDLFEYYKKLIALRKQNPALSSDNIEFFHENPEAKLLAYSRWYEEGSRVVVVANFSDNFLSGYQVPNFPEAGTWHEWIGDYNVEAGKDGIVIDIGGYEAKVFVSP
jgi:1,4-alpha-glucan branching enzyme